MQKVDTTTVAIKVYVCDNNADGVRDASLQTEALEFYNLCPDTSSGQLQRKLVYVRAYEKSPTYFVSLVGIQTVPISTTAVAEAAPVDLVIVLDTSESMGRDSPNYNSGDFDPAACNAITTTDPSDPNYHLACQPLTTAKAAAKGLINSLYPGYDRVAVVTFDSQAHTPVPLGDPGTAAGAIDSGVKLHDDPPSNKLFASWDNNGTGGRVNPVDPEDRDNDGADADPKNSPAADSTVCTPDGSGWYGGDPRANPPTGIPCDTDTIQDPSLQSTLDAFDWNQNGQFDYVWPCVDDINIPDPPGDNCKSQYWIKYKGPMSLVSTCTGCGIRQATDELVNNARSNAVQVIVFLSDGMANMSDTFTTFPYNSSTKQGVPNLYPNGFCGGKIDVSGTTIDPPHLTNFWKTNCIDWNVPPSYQPPSYQPDILPLDCSASDDGKTNCRYCIKEDPGKCPPGSFRLGRLRLYCSLLPALQRGRLRARHDRPRRADRNRQLI